MWLIENYQSRTIFLSVGLKSDLTPRLDIFVRYSARLIKLVVKTLKTLSVENKTEVLRRFETVSRKKSK